VGWVSTRTNERWMLGNVFSNPGNQRMQLAGREQLAGEGTSDLCTYTSRAFAIEFWSDEGTEGVQATCIPR
jgi:hypothetical protein